MPSYVSAPVDAGQNPAYALAYTGSELTTVDLIVLGATYRKTLTWTGGKLTAVSPWVKQ